MANLDEIKEMLDLMDERGLEEFELERDGFRVKLRKQSTAMPSSKSEVVVAKSAADVSVEGVGSSEIPVDDGLVRVESPIVGTFYRAPDPEGDPFVKVGSQVQKGEVLCIIEAMKLMNEIDADQDGEIVKIFVENGQAVEYGEVLFAMKPA
jgi:acetyl-CoA carboxylase biotin carboxyl carrier protein